MFDCFMLLLFFIFITCFLEKLVPRLRKGLSTSSAEELVKRKASSRDVINTVISTLHKVVMK